MPLDHVDLQFCFGDDITLDAREFQRVMYGELAEDEYLMQTAFEKDPTDAGLREWAGWATQKLQDFSDRNSYVSPAVFKGDVEVTDSKTGEIRKRRRRYELMACMSYLIVDDERIDGATGVIQTSRSSYQSLFKLDEPITDANVAKFASDALQRRGKEGGKNDPGGNNGVRWGRAPVGVNTKKKYGKPFHHKVVVWSPERTWSLEELSERLKITLEKRDSGWEFGAVPDYIGRRYAANDDLSAGLRVEGEFPPADALKIADKCQTIGRMRDTKGGDQSEEEWLAALRVLVRTKQGDDVCHDWSSGHPGYSAGACQEKINHARTMGATTCMHMRSVSEHCAGCQQTCNSPIRLGEPDAKKRSGFRLTHVGELLRPPPPLEWLVRGLLLPASQALLFGEPGTAKSFYALDLACCIGVGHDWHGHKTKKGAVVYVAGEGQFGISRRMLAWGIENNCIDELKRAPIVVSSTGAQFTDANSFSEVVEAIEGVESEHGQIALIVIDTLHRNLGGDENSADDISIYYHHADQLRDKFGATVLTVHHSGHAEKNRSRGSSAIRAATDFEFLMENTNLGTRRLSSTKVKDGPTPIPLHFDLKSVELPWKDSDGQPETSAVLVSITAPKTVGGNLTKAQQEIMTAIRQAIDEAGAPVSEQAWREAYRQRRLGDKPDTIKKAFARAKTELLDLGEIEADGETFQPKRDTGQDRDIGGQSPEP